MRERRDAGQRSGRYRYQRRLRGSGHARPGPLAAVAAGLAALAVAVAGCGPVAPAAAGLRGQPGVIHVVAAENFWGSIARQLGGSHAAVFSIISDPNADPHSYEGTAATARALARANLVIRNGAGYDAWMGRLMAASPNPHRVVLTVGDLVGKRPGDNPHLWYDPGYVTIAEKRIEAAYKALDPEDTAYFSARRAAADAAFAGVRARLAQLRRRDAGKPVASTESIVVYLARYLGLRLISPPAFMTAVAEGAQPPASSITVFARQLATHQADVLVYNEQTATALTTSMRELAMRYHVPVVGITETIQPPQESFERWFGGELAALSRALGGRAR